MGAPTVVAEQHQSKLRVVTLDINGHSHSPKLYKMLSFLFARKHAYAEHVKASIC